MIHPRSTLICVHCSLYRFLLLPTSYLDSYNTFKSVRFKHMQHIFSLFYNNSQSCKKKKKKNLAMQHLGLNHTFFIKPTTITWTQTNDQSIKGIRIHLDCSECFANKKNLITKAADLMINLIGFVAGMETLNRQVPLSK